jgi:putative membrane protein
MSASAVRRAVALALLAFTAYAPAAAAHTGPPPAPDNAWSSWNFEPVLLAALVLIAWAYTVGVRVLWSRAGAGGGIERWRVACFAAGMLALIIALISPLDGLGSALFSAHMAQHMLLILVAAPLLSLGAPGTALLWVLPLNGRRRMGRWWMRSAWARALWHACTRLGVAWAIATATLWAWHAPALYQAALKSESVHVLEHASFLFASCLFWWALARRGRRSRASYGVSIFAVFAMALQGGTLGALLTFSATPWYPVYAATTAPYGLSPLDDQQLAGLIMWIPAGVIYLLAACGLFVAWLSAAEAEERRREAQWPPAPLLPPVSGG